MTGFVLHTDTIEETCATLKARGVTLTQELTTQPWGKWAQFTDLDDNEFGRVNHFIARKTLPII